jgi:hypothetical protein
MPTAYRIATSALAPAVSQTLAATSTDFSDVQSPLAIQQQPHGVATAATALDRARQRYAQALRIADQYAAQYRTGANATLDPSRVEQINNLMLGDTRGFSVAIDFHRLALTPRRHLRTIVRRATRLGRSECPGTHRKNQNRSCWA